jgi:diguanylate cyclase (GGDEF)-like protein/PAS domain S-box-containing protein
MIKKNVDRRSNLRANKNPFKSFRQIADLETMVNQLQNELRHSAALNRAVFEHAPVGISVRLGSGKLLAVNRAWKKIWRLTNRQIRENERKSQRWNIKQRYPYLRNLSPRVRRIFTRGGELFLPELRISDPRPGLPKWISQYYYAIQDRKGRVEFIVTMTQNITAQKEAAGALRESEEKFRTIVQNVNIGVYRTTGDIKGRYLQINPAFAKIFGYPSVKDMMKTRVIDLYQKTRDRQIFIRELKSRGYVRNKELLLWKKDRAPIWVSVYAKAQHDERGKVKWIDGVIEDITERKQMEEQLRAISLVDDLTGLYNRRGFLTLAEHQLKIASRAKKVMFLLFLDLDNLKDVNDKFGHPIGDRALVQTTQILKKTFRGSDIIARIGGDEFVVLTLEISNASARTFYARLQKSLDSFNKHNRLPFALALSFGWARYDPARPRTIQTLLTQADRMMYRHKHSKKINPPD